MPPRRRRSGNSAASTTNTHQQTLSFGGSKSRVSKPTSLKHSKDISSSSPVEIPSHTRHKKPSIASKSPSLSVSSSTTSSIAGDEDAEVHEDGEATAQLNPIAASSKSENVVREQARVQAQLPRSEEDKQALALTDAHIREYWATEESSRRAPRGKTIFLFYSFVYILAFYFDFGREEFNNRLLYI